MGSDLKGTRIKPHPSAPPGMRIEAIAAEAITKNQIVYVDTANAATNSASTQLALTVKQQVGVATNATRAKAVGDLYLALNGGAAGDRIVLSPVGLLRNLDTSGSSKGSPVYLGTAGAPTLTAAGQRRRVGTVLVVGAVGTGVVSFHPTGHTGTIFGIAAVSAAASVALDTTALGGNFDGAPVIATVNTGTTVYVVTAAWNGSGTLTITLSGSLTGNVSYMIAA